jgi:hypothetical protein
VSDLACCRHILSRPPAPEAGSRGRLVLRTSLPGEQAAQPAPQAYLGRGASERHASPLDAEPDQGPDLGAELDRLVQGEVAEVGHLELALGVFVDGQGVDHPDGVAVPEAFQLLDDLTVEDG